MRAIFWCTSKLFFFFRENENVEVEAAPVEEEPKELTLDEWKAQRAGRIKPQYNIRKAGEGEDQSQWKKMYELNKKKPGEEEVYNHFSLSILNFLFYFVFLHRKAMTKNMMQPSILKELADRNIYWTLIFTFLTQGEVVAAVDAELGQAEGVREQIDNNVFAEPMNK